MSDETKPQEANGEVLEKDEVEHLIESLEGMTFDADIKELGPFNVKYKGVTLKLMIREIDCKQREDYMSLQATKAKYGGKGDVVGIKDTKGMHSRLLSWSLYNIDAKGAVPEEVILSWGSNTTTKLFNIAARLSGLDNKAEARAKNSSEVKS